MTVKKINSIQNANRSSLRLNDNLGKDVHSTVARLVTKLVCVRFKVPSHQTNLLDINGTIFKKKEWPICMTIVLQRKRLLVFMIKEVWF